LTFAHDRFRGQELKREYAQFGYRYVSTGRKLQPAPGVPDFLRELVTKAGAHYPKVATFNQCIATHYPSGAGIGRHTDADRFGDVIIAISLGGNAKLRFRPDGAAQDTYELIVAPGSLYVMQGPARWNYQHQVLPVKTDRYSLTFRQVLEQQQ
jgi:alkylated DNA repair dioxygenase AlkB